MASKEYMKHRLHGMATITKLVINNVKHNMYYSRSVTGQHVYELFNKHDEKIGQIDKTAGFDKVTNKVRDPCCIGDLFVDDKFRRQGYGSLLLSYMENISHCQKMEVISGSKESEKFYKKNGYKRCESHVEQYMNKLKSRHCYYKNFE